MTVQHGIIILNDIKSQLDLVKGVIVTVQHVIIVLNDVKSQLDLVKGVIVTSVFLAKRFSVASHS